MSINPSMNRLNINANNIMVSGNYGFNAGLQTGLRAYGDIMFNGNTILGKLLADLNAYNGGNVNVSGNTINPPRQRAQQSPAQYFFGGNFGFNPYMMGGYNQPSVSSYYPPAPQFQAPIYFPQPQQAYPGQSQVANYVGPGAYATAMAGIR